MIRLITGKSAWANDDIKSRNIPFTNMCYINCPLHVVFKTFFECEYNFNFR